jgi:hypothetical protein
MIVLHILLLHGWSCTILLSSLPSVVITCPKRFFFFRNPFNFSCWYILNSIHQSLLLYIKFSSTHTFYCTYHSSWIPSGCMHTLSSQPSHSKSPATLHSAYGSLKLWSEMEDIVPEISWKKQISNGTKIKALMESRYAKNKCWNMNNVSTVWHPVDTF